MMLKLTKSKLTDWDERRSDVPRQMLNKKQMQPSLLIS